MKVKISSVLDAPIERVWEYLMKPSVLDFIAFPLVRFKYQFPPPDKWIAGSYTANMLLLGFLPAGAQTINIEFPDGGADKLVLRDNGTGNLAKTWDHWIYLEKEENNTTVYTDEVYIKAGILTPFVWFFALLFYNYRQSRWKKLVENNFKLLKNNSL